MVPIITFCGVLMCRVNLYAHAAVLTCPHTNCMQCVASIEAASYFYFVLQFGSCTEGRDGNLLLPECLMAGEMP